MQLHKDIDSGSPARVVSINHTTGDVKAVLSGDGDEVALAQGKCLKPVHFDGKTIFYDSECGCVVEVGDPVVVYVDGCWTSQYELDHAPRVRDVDDDESADS